MKDFGFTLQKGRILDFDTNDFSLKNTLIENVCSYKRCIGCGACSSSCSAAAHTDFSILKCNNLFRSGDYAGLADELDKCMLCGKCTLACPRGVNIRAMVMKIRELFTDKNKK
jgi:heterodisulfide reductase subunit C